MTPETLELGRRAVAAKRWRWLPGMRPVRSHDDGCVFRHGTHIPDRLIAAELHGNLYWVPDLSDPCTLGGLLHLVREAWGDPHITTEYDGGRWWVHGGDFTTLCAHPGAAQLRTEGKRCCIGGPCYSPAAGLSEAGALVAALEAAP